MRTVKEVFGVDKPIIGMLHLSGYGREKVLENARREIDIMYRNGVNAVLVENYFGNRVDVENALKLLQRDYPDKVYGVNMLGFPVLIAAAFPLWREFREKQQVWYAQSCLAYQTYQTAEDREGMNRIINECLRRFPSPDDLRHVKIMKNVWTIEE